LYGSAANAQLLSVTELVGDEPTSFVAADKAQPRRQRSGALDCEQSAKPRKPDPVVTSLVIRSETQ
jgi:hypothetical protein